MPTKQKAAIGRHRHSTQEEVRLSLQAINNVSKRISGDRKEIIRFLYKAGIVTKSGLRLAKEYR